MRPHAIRVRIRSLLVEGGAATGRLEAGALAAALGEAMLAHLEAGGDAADGAHPDPLVRRIGEAIWSHAGQVPRGGDLGGAPLPGGQTGRSPLASSTGARAPQAAP